MDKFDTLAEACEYLRSTGQVYTCAIILAPVWRCWQIVNLADEPSAADLGLTQRSALRS